MPDDTKSYGDRPADRGAAGLPGSLFDDPEVGQAFLDDPEAFLERYDLTVGDLACPPLAHEARDRAERFVDDVADPGVEPSVDSIRELREHAVRHFGDDATAELIPFGLRFAERVRIDPGLGITATGTAEITWLDKGVDHDG